MNCPHCGREMVERLVVVCACEASPPMKIIDVPALVCDSCGERFYQDNTSRLLVEIKSRRGLPESLEQLHVFRFGQPARSVHIPAEVRLPGAASDLYETVRQAMISEPRGQIYDSDTGSETDLHQTVRS